MTRRTRSWNAFETTLDVNVDAGAMNISVHDVGHVGDETYLVIDPEDTNKREYVKVVNVNVGANTFENCLRGLEGSAGGVAVAHDAGAIVRAVAVHQWLDDVFDDLEGITKWAKDHVDGGDWHPQYLLDNIAKATYVKLTTQAADGPQVLSGPITLEDTLSMETPSGNPNKIVHVGRPDEDDDAATKGYVDDQDEANLKEIAIGYLPLTGGKISDALRVEGRLSYTGAPDAGPTHLPNMLVDHRGMVYRTVREVATKDHTHTVADLSGLAAVDHTHTAADLSGLAAVDHTHAAAPIADLPFEQHAAGGAFRAGSVDNWRETTLTTVLTTKVTLPPGTWTVVVQSDGQFATLGPVGAKTFVKARVRINGKYPAYNTSPSISDGGHFQPIANHSLANLSGVVTMEVQYSLGDYAGTGVFGALRFVEATWQAFKTGR